MVALAGAVLALAVGTPAPAGASRCADADSCGLPKCFETEIWARPGLDRDFRLPCYYTDSARLITPPVHGTLTDLRHDGPNLNFRYRADDDAPWHDGFDVELTGPAGGRTQHVDVVVPPRSVNTPPHCDPASTAKRTPGTEPAEVTFYAWCHDDEHDDMTLDGNGPGTFLDAPAHVEQWQTALPSWGYRTATVRGDESATYWATDALGARSPEAALNVRVGPDVNRPPVCWPNPWFPAPVTPIYTRPGATRRFGLRCTDADGDAFVPRVTDPPSRGVFAEFLPMPALPFWGGSEVWVDVTYIPLDHEEGDDPFSVVASDQAGDGPVSRLRMAARAVGNSGGGGSYDGARTLMGVPTTVFVEYGDSDGDPLEYKVTTPPQHGTAGPPVITLQPFGATRATIAYAPDPGFLGIDCLIVTVTDGHGTENAFKLTISVVETLEPTVHPVSLVPYQPIPGVAPHGPFVSASTGQPRPVAPAEQARRILSTRHVRLLKRLGDARVYGARGRPRSLALTCALPCRATWRPSVARTGGARATRLQRLAVRRGVAGPAGALALHAPARATAIHLRVAAAHARPRDAALRLSGSAR